MRRRDFKMNGFKVKPRKFHSTRVQCEQWLWQRMQDLLTTITISRHVSRKEYATIIGRDILLAGAENKLFLHEECYNVRQKLKISQQEFRSTSQRHVLDASAQMRFRWQSGDLKQGGHRLQMKPGRFCGQHLHCCTSQRP